jgi:RimJ/RimL family protein N-acetyltransferase
MLDPIFIISTPRLTISHLNPSNEQHVDHVYALNPTVYADREAARAFIQQRVKMMETIGYGRYLISLTPEGESMRGNNFPADANGRKLIGIVAVQLARFPNGPKVPDLGFAVLPEHRGKGYATEAAERVLQ